MKMRAKQAVWCNFIFHHQFTRWCWFEGSYMCCPARNWTCLHRVASEPERCPVSLQSVWKQRCHLIDDHYVARWDTTALGDDGWHRRRARGSMTVACLFPASWLQGGGRGRALGWGCCSGCPWAAHLLFSGSCSCLIYSRLIATWLVFFLQAGSSYTWWAGRS